MRIFKKLASRGIAGISDCLIMATLFLLFWFIFMSESEYRYVIAGFSCLGFVAAYFVYRFADKIHDGI
ncbi:ABC-type Fe3+-siderophore transport system permease subunit [Erwinia toletana]|uniref:ABC-type Fe3+-siderophore transport system permease subunit n=1 Tax=Winslowiella toletana TaxID=92490 RepID=A0ABS4P476_9GAMM|nr:ABC-type Fe3+-siderophore transport system permease subunit [Winslowiella toletana]